MVWQLYLSVTEARVDRQRLSDSFKKIMISFPVQLSRQRVEKCELHELYRLINRLMDGNHQNIQFHK